MKNKGIHFLLSTACVLWLVVAGDALAQSARVAVAGDPSLANLIDATTVQLSTEPELTVLERADLDKLGQEQALQSVLSSNDFSSVRVLPADGLVLLRAVKQDGKVGIFARLVAVQPGVVLREVALPDSADPQVQAQALVKEFTPYWSKLAAIQKGKITALSLLGLRFEVDAPETREIERSINVMLASRLSAEPDTMVLERWRLNDAVFEKSITAQEPAPFWTGSSLIDGSMKWEDKHVVVTLRMRPPQGAEVSISDTDTANNLPALVGRLADKIRNHPISQDAWNPSAEAGHYAELGKWCLDNHLYDEGAEAIESALALGDDSPATHCLQIRAYASLAYTNEPPNAESIYDPAAPKMDPESLPSRVKSGTTAADLALRYLKGNQNFSGQPGSLEDPVTVCLPALDNCLRLLRFAYQKGFEQNHGDETTALRQAVQNLIAQMDTLPPAKPSDAHDTLLKYEVRYAPYWHETPEATVAYYRDLLNRKTDGAFIRTELFITFYFSLHPAYLPSEEQLKAANPTNDPRIANMGIWYVGSPRIIAWDDRPEAKVLAVWDDFLKELRTSPDPVLQADALKFESSPAYTLGIPNENAAADGARLIALLEQNQPCVAGPRGNDFMVGLSYPLYSDILYPKDKSNLNRLRDLGEALLKQKAAVAPEWIKWMPVLYREAPPDMAGRILASLDAYRQWYLTQVPQDAELVKALDDVRRALVVYAGATPESPREDFLTVDQHWPVQDGTEGDPNSMVYPVGVTTAENRVWFFMFGGRHIRCVDPSTLQTVSTFTIPDQLISDHVGSPGGVALEVTPQFLVAAVFGHAMLCARADNSWRRLEVPPSNYKPCWVDQQLYLAYDAETELKNYQDKGTGAASAISGLIHVSLPDGGIENLVSTRRVPPQSNLDGKPLGYPLDLWSSPAGLRLAVDADSPHFQVYGTPAGKNDWAPVTTDPMWCDVKVGSGGALVGKGFDDHGFAQIVLMNGTESEVLLTNPNRAPANGDPMARWDIPGEITKIPPDMLWQASAVMHGDDLCLYCNVRNATQDGFQACVYYFAKGQKGGVKIPLRFQAKDIRDPKLLGAQSVIHDYQSLQTTDYGLIIVQEMELGGFWVVPWSAIDAYRAPFSGGSVQTAASPAATVRATEPKAPAAVAPPALVTPPAMPPQTTPTAPMVAPGTTPPPPPSTPIAPTVRPVPVTPSDPYAHD